MKKNNLEDLFKDSFENFEADVDPGVWKNVQTGLKGAGLGLLGKMLVNKLGSSAIVAIVSSAAAVIATIFVMNGTKTETETKTETKTPKTITQPKIITEAKKPSVNEIKNFLATENNKKTETPVVKNEAESNANNSDLTIKKDKINSVIKGYTEQSIANISASPIGGEAPLVVNLTNNGIGKINKWDFGDGRKETGANPPHYYDEPGIYTIVLTSTSAEGKTSTDSIKIEVIARENSSVRSASGDFSPNGDGVRDYFGFDTKNLINQNVIVFDKNKTIIYKSESLSAKWDGTNLKGKKVKEGEYFYIQKAEGKDGKKYEQSGKITLKR